MLKTPTANSAPLREIIKLSGEENYQFALALHSKIEYNTMQKDSKGVSSMMATNLTIRIDPTLKANAESLFGELGMSLSTAFNVFLRQAVRTQSIPFSITCAKSPNASTLAAMREAEQIAYDENTHAYSSRKELKQSLEA